MSTTLRLTLAEYDGLVEDGMFERLKNRHIELIYGELREMSPTGIPHSRYISRLNRWSTSNTSEADVEVRIQMPIGIPDLDSAPEPDVVWARTVPLTDPHQRPKDILLLIEVSDSSLTYDLGEKAGLYAEAGIADYWVVDIPHQIVHVHRRPTAQGYEDVVPHPAGDIVTLAPPHARLDVRRFFTP